MKHFCFLIVAALAVTACTKAPQETQEASQEPTIVQDFSLTKKCSDGSNIYQIDGGSYATWDGQNNQWVKLSPGVTPDQFCQ